MNKESKAELCSLVSAMPSGKERTTILGIPDHVRIRNADSKCAQWTKTDPKSTEYRYDDKGNLVKRFGEGYGADPWQLLPKRAIDAFVPERPVYKPSGKPAKAWRKGNEKPIVTDRLGRKTVFKPA